MNFYFTYGRRGHPFAGGWTLVAAPNRETAIGAFRAVHPDKVKNRLNCSCVYTEREFQETGMGDDDDGNYGAFCWEIINVTVQQLLPSAKVMSQADDACELKGEVK